MRAYSVRHTRIKKLPKREKFVRLSLEMLEETVAFIRYEKLSLFRFFKPPKKLGKKVMSFLKSPLQVGETG